MTTETKTLKNIQLTASDPKNSVWVAASAGSGKTTVLTNRVLRLLLSGVNPGRILCLTFTNAASSEMANRVNKALARWVVKSDEELSSEIYRLTGGIPDDEMLKRSRCLFAQVLDTPDGLKIQTIHAFCQMLMQRFPLEAGLAYQYV